MSDALSMGMQVGPRWTNPNPAVQRFGFRKDGGKCKGCAFLLETRSDSKKKFYKCKKRIIFEGLTHGPRTDHRISWDACAKFEEGTISR
jgi:hypothetical protein